MGKQRHDWAVLCSVSGKSTILVFAQGGSRPAAELAAFDDDNFVQSVEPGKNAFSRVLAPIGPRRILQYYHALGGPKPPPLDHHGIDDAFAGKASTVQYFHKGSWLELTGAD